MALSKKEIEKYQELLLREKNRLTKILKGNVDQIKSPEESKGYSQHQADEGTDDSDRSINIKLSDGEFHILRQIDRALKKIEDGTYGVCDVTQEPIPKKRLDFMPYACITVEAQEMVEKGLIDLES